MIYYDLADLVHSYNNQMSFCIITTVKM